MHTLIVPLKHERICIETTIYFGPYSYIFVRFFRMFSTDSSSTICAPQVSWIEIIFKDEMGKDWNVLDRFIYSKAFI